MERNLIIQHTMIGLWNPLSIRPKIETCDLSVMSVSTLLVSWHGGWSRVQFCWACLGPTNIWKGSNFNHASHRRFVSDGCHYQFWILNIIIAGTFHWILLRWNLRFFGLGFVRVSPAMRSLPKDKSWTQIGIQSEERVKQLIGPKVQNSSETSALQSGPSGIILHLVHDLFNRAARFHSIASFN